MRYSSYLLPIALVIIILLILFSMITGHALGDGPLHTPTPDSTPPAPTQTTDRMHTLGTQSRPRAERGEHHAPRLTLRCLAATLRSSQHEQGSLG